MQSHADMDEFERRRRTKNRQRHQRWEERKERSKLSRTEIDELRTRCEELRHKLDAKAEAGEENQVAEEGDTFTRFDELPISQRTQMGLERGNYKKLTPIQSETIHLTLAGYDVLGAAKTGSGKTLCFVIPVLERLFREHWEADMGLGALLLSPTRELALQIFKVMQVVGYKHVLSAALLTGGRDVNEERKRLHAISIIVGTPGRVLHHLQDVADMVLDNLQIFCMDEADRLLDLGFRETISGILRYLPPQRQTLLFSATQTTDVRMLAELALRNPRYVTAHPETAAPMPSSLCQNFIVLELHRKLDALLMFLKRHPNDKVVVFISTCNQVRYMYLAFSKILKKMRIPSMCLTSKMKQFRREEVFLTFCRCKSAVLFCTDVAARGLDFPLVHWVIQYDCPDSAQTYIHRAGRTARAGARGVSLLFLTPRETPMLSYLANKKVNTLREIAIRPNLMHVSQEIFVALVVQGLKYEAQKAFIAYLRSIYFASNKHVFDLKSIDVEKFAHSLGLMVVPDMSELNDIHRSAKNLPWDVVNYMERVSKKRDKAAAAAAGEKGGEADDDEARDGSHGSSSDEEDEEKKETLTRKERHLRASDMFRVLAQKQRYNVKKSDSDSDDGDFFTKKEVDPATAAARAAEMSLTAEERMAGLSRHKKRKFIETADLRVRDLGLSKRVVFKDDDDDDDDDEADEAGSAGKAPTTITAVQLDQLRERRRGSDAHDEEGEDDEGASSGADDSSEVDGEVGYADQLRARIMAQKTDDRERARQLRRVRRLQRSGRLSKKATLDDAANGGGGGAQLRTSDNDDDDDSDSDISSDGSLARLIRAAKGELYPENGDNSNDDDRGVDSDVGESDEDARYGTYHGIDSSDDNDEDVTAVRRRPRAAAQKQLEDSSSEEEVEQPPPRRRRK